MKSIPRVQPHIVDDIPDDLKNRYDPSRAGHTAPRYADSSFTTVTQASLDSTFFSIEKSMVL